MTQESRLSIRTSPLLLYGTALLLIFVAALFLRIYFAYDNVFPDDWVRFQINDPWFHMRQIESMVHHFPDRNLFDPYGHFSDGQSAAVAPFFDFIVALSAWVIGLGSPSKHVVETVGAYFPPILGALTTIVMFFLGSALFNKRVGLLAAALMAVLPGQYLLRTLLGFSDQHCAEILLSLLFILMFVLAIKSARSRELTFDHIKRRDWSVIRRPLLLSVLTGIVLGCYLITWLGGTIFIFIIFAFLIVQSVVDNIRGRPVDYLCSVGVVAFVVALIIVAGVSSLYLRSNEQIGSLLVGLLAFAAIWAGSAFISGKGWPRWAFPAALAGGLGLGYLLFWLIDPSLLSAILDRFGMFSPTAAKGTISEVQSLSWGDANSYFTTGRIVAPIGLVALAWLVVRKPEPDKIFILVWSIILLLATWKLTRFGYYSAANVAILTAYLAWLVLRVASFGKAEEEPQRVQAPTVAPKKEETKQRLTRKETRKERREARKKARKAQRRNPLAGSPLWRYVYIAVALVVIFFFFGYYYNINMSITWAEGLRGPTDDWRSALVWMRDNTPPPFGNATNFYDEYETPALGEKYPYPETAYGVMSWWDYGYHITYIAQRIPNTNPSGQKDASNAAVFFTAQDEASASLMLDSTGTKYVIIDIDMYLPKFYAMAIIAEKSESDFFEIVYTQQGQAFRVYYPEYYQSMVSRLYSFGGEAWDPDAWVSQHPDDKITAMRFQLVKDAKGNQGKQVADYQEFDTYAEAKEFVEENTAFRIVGTSLAVSPVPLEKLEHYNVVYESPTTSFKRGDDTISEVMIFEYIP